MVDGHGSHVTIEFVDFCLTVNIIVYRLLPHSIHLLNVGLFSPLQKAHGIQVVRHFRFGNVAVTKGDFPPILVSARTSTYPKKNILTTWREAGLIPINPRRVLDKLTHGLTAPRARSSTPPPELPTPCNTPDLHRRVTESTPGLKSKDVDLNTFNRLKNSATPEYLNNQKTLRQRDNNKILRAGDSTKAPP